MRIINVKKKKMKLLTNELQSGEMFEEKYVKDKKYCNVRDHCHYKGNIEVLHIAYVIQNIAYLKK